MQPQFTSQKLLIVGNGFDLNLGLKTSYTNFIDSEQFAVLLGRRNMLAEYLKMQQDIYNWIDVEKEIKRYSKESEFDREEDKAFKKEFNDLKLMLMEYLRLAQSAAIKQESQAAKIMQSLKDHSSWTILDFNYTDSVELLLNALDIKRHNKTAHIKIHGSLDRSNIILGVEDSSGVPHEHVFLNKSFNPSYGAIDVPALLNTSKRIEFFGYSFGETDHMYFKEFFRDQFSGLSRRPDPEILAFKYSYYGEDSYQDIYTNLHVLTDHNYSALGRNFKFEVNDLSLQKVEEPLGVF